MKMEDFSRQEKIILGFLSLVLVAGISVDFYRKTQNQPKLNPVAFEIEELKPPTANSGKININQADINELSRLPGVGDVLAARIVEYRKRNGNFNQKQDLLKVKGIGRKKLSEIEKFLTF